MKKAFFLVALVLLGTSTAFSQLSYGLKSGLNLADFTRMKGTSDMKTSFYAGGFLEYRGKNVGISPELYYSRQGFQQEDGEVMARFRFNYLNVPMMLKIYVVKGLSVDFGTQVGCLLNSKLWMEADGQTVTLDMEKVTGTKMSVFDIGFVVGLTCNVEKFFLQGRYNLGITPVSPDDPDESCNKVFQFGIGYRFR
ncbi:MAG: PorT family protein [Culturomica sp.]|nr:PorT family protein [Culturomica sp.]